MLRPFEKCYSLLTKDFFTQEVLPSMTLIKLNRQTSWDKVGQQPTGLFNYMKSSSPRYYNHLHHHYPCHQRHFIDIIIIFVITITIFIISIFVIAIIIFIIITFLIIVVIFIVIVIRTIASLIFKLFYHFQ